MYQKIGGPSTRCCGGTRLTDYREELDAFRKLQVRDSRVREVERMYKGMKSGRARRANASARDGGRVDERRHFRGDATGQEVDHDAEVGRARRSKRIARQGRDPGLLRGGPAGAADRGRAGFRAAS